MKSRLEENGHQYTIIRKDDVPIVRINSVNYELIPEAIQGRVAIHGVRLIRCIV